MPLNLTTDQKVLKAFINRRHPKFAEFAGQWAFFEDTYLGGRGWFDANLFRYIKEGDREFTDRLRRAYRFNHTREVVDLLNKYIFKSGVIRNTADANQEIKAFWNNATKGGLPIDQYMKVIAQQSSIFGRIWVFVDSNRAPDAVTVADAKAAGARVYSYSVKPQNILDVGYDSMGKLLWILVMEELRDDQDPIRASGGITVQFRLWARDAWALFEVQGSGAKQRVVLVEQGENPIGVVPCFPVDHIHSEDPYTAPSMIGDIAYLDRAVANYLSNLDAIIQDQTFSQLAMPAQNLMPGEDKYDKLLEMGTKRVFLFDGEGGAKPEYLSPDVKQAQVVVQVINKIIGEIYHTLGMAGERTKQDNVQGIDNSSGVAKAYDFERLNSLLVAKADSLEMAENRLIELVERWHSRVPADDQQANSLVKYPESFDVRSYYDEFEVAARLAMIEGPAALRQENMRSIVDKLYPRLAADLKKAIEADIKQWPPVPVDPATGNPLSSPMELLRANRTPGGTLTRE